LTITQKNQLALIVGLLCLLP